MAFTAGEIASIANASLDYYFNKGGAFDQTIQEKPLLNLLEGRKKTFPGGKGNISLAVVGAYGDGSGNDVVKGYTHNDAVTFFTPANIKRANYPWREHHIGLTLTHTELKIDGISVVDTNGERTTEHSKREMTVLVNLLEQKLFSLGEQYARTMNALLWGDGSTDAKALAGMQSIIKANPCVGTVGGLDQTAATGFTWWRNRAFTAAMAAQIGTVPGDAISGGGPITSNPANGGALLQQLQHTYFQLIRYGGKPSIAFAGSAFIDALMIERRANGYYSMTGFSGSQDVSVGDTILPGGTKVQYDPTLDDLGFSKRLYWFDPKAIFLMAMEDEWRSDHTPARPYNIFVLYKSITSTGQMVASMLNSSVVMDIA
jgi:hypothetical protein